VELLLTPHESGQDTGKVPGTPHCSGLYNQIQASVAL